MVVALSSPRGRSAPPGQPGNEAMRIAVHPARLDRVVGRSEKLYGRMQVLLRMRPDGRVRVVLALRRVRRDGVFDRRADARKRGLSVIWRFAGLVAGLGKRRRLLVRRRRSRGRRARVALALALGRLGLLLIRLGDGHPRDAAIQREDVLISEQALEVRCRHCRQPSLDVDSLLLRSFSDGIKAFSTSAKSVLASACSSRVYSLPLHDLVLERP